jgi:hypothetical protein
MYDIFFSHVEEDADISLQIALQLEKEGYSTWSYEVDSIPGSSYLLETGQAIDNAQVIIVIISPHSIGSRQVTNEVVRAHEAGKHFIPIRRDISHIEFQNRQPEWREAIGAALTIGMPADGVDGLIPRITKGIKKIGLTPHPSPDDSHMAQITQALKEFTGVRPETEEHSFHPPDSVKAAENELHSGISEISGDSVEKIQGKIDGRKIQLVDDILAPGESIILETRSSVASWVVRPAFYLIIGIILTLFVASAISGDGAADTDVVKNSAAEVSQTFGTIVYYFGVAVIAFAIIKALVRLLRWSSTVLVLTDRRLIKQCGIITRHYLDFKMNEIWHINVKRPLFGIIFNFGNIQFSTNNYASVMNWEGVPDPLQIQKTIKSRIPIRA